MFEPMLSITQALKIPDFFVYAIVVIGALYIYSTWTFATFKNMNVPGPKPIPLLGTSHLYFEKGLYYDSDLQAKYGRTFGVFDGVNPVFVTSDLDLIKQIAIKDFDSFHSHRRLFFNKSVQQSIGALKDEKWRAVRSATLSAFNTAKLKRITPLINGSAKKLVQSMAAYAKKEESFDVMQPCKEFMMEVIAKAHFATEYQKEADSQFLSHAQKIFDALGGFRPQMLVYMFLPQLVSFMEYFDVAGIFPDDSICFFKSLIKSIIKQRSQTKEKPADFLQALLDTRNRGKASKTEMPDEDVSQLVKAADVFNKTFVKQEVPDLTDEEIAGSSVTFLVAGFEGTSTTVAYMMYSLALHQDVQEKLYEEIKKHVEKNQEVTFDILMKLKYLDQFVNEVTRMHSISLRTDRVCNKTCQVGPYTISKGMQVQIAIRNVHYDEEYWPEPHKFDPDRFSPENRYKIIPNSLISFGLGLRTCLGLRLALLEVKVAIIHIVNEYHISRCEKTEVPLTYRKHLGSVPANGIWVAIKRRDGSFKN